MITLSLFSHLWHIYIEGYDYKENYCQQFWFNLHLGGTLHQGNHSIVSLILFWLWIILILSFWLFFWLLNFRRQNTLLPWIMKKQDWQFPAKGHSFRPWMGLAALLLQDMPAELRMVIACLEGWWLHLMEPVVWTSS